MPGHLAEFVIGKEGMNLAGMLRNQLGNLHEHSIAEVEPVDQTFTMNQLVQHHVVIDGFSKLRQSDDLLKADGIVVKITGHQQTASTRQSNRAALPPSVIQNDAGGVAKDLNHLFMIPIIHFRLGIEWLVGHGFTLAITSTRPFPVAVYKVTGA